MKQKIALVTIMILAVFISAHSIAEADAGPKPSITVIAKNMPEDLSYMDLLVDYECEGVDGRFLDSEVYDRELVSRLAAYDKNGWNPVTICEGGPVFGDIECVVEAGNCTMHYGYMVPDRFKIMVVSKNGDTVVSNVIDRKLFESRVLFDYETGQAKEKAVMPSVAGQFAMSLPLTLILEGVVLLLFGFSIRRNWVVFLAMNTFTQIILAAAVTIGMLLMGLFGAYLAYVLSEIVILILEGVVFGLALKEYKFARRVIFSITANIVSFAAGIATMAFML
jgi:hypothetical protein